MTDSILDNQQITADILNSISIDLGNDDLSFTETERFGADKLNKITGDLVGAGILSSGNNCEIFIANDKIYIKSGIIVFADGKKKTINENTEIGQLGDCSIYALNDTSSNTIKLIAGADYPASGDFVKLARVANSKVIDERRIAVSKVNALGSRTPMTIQKTITLSGTEPAQIPLTNAPVGIVYGRLRQNTSSKTYYAELIYNAYDGKFGFPGNQSDTVLLHSTGISFNITDGVLKIKKDTEGDMTIQTDMIAV